MASYKVSLIDDEITITKITKKTVLKSGVKRVLGLASCIAIIGCIWIVWMYQVNNYNSMLKDCDNTKGYTCNIFGK